MDIKFNCNCDMWTKFFVEMVLKNAKVSSKEFEVFAADDRRIYMNTKVWNDSAKPTVVGMMRGGWEKRMDENNLPTVAGAEKYRIGQAVIPTEAAEIRRILKRAYLDSEGMGILDNSVEFAYPSNLPFLSLFLKMIDEGRTTTDRDPWADPLNDMLTSDDHYAMKHMLDGAKTTTRRKMRRNKK